MVGSIWMWLAVIAVIAVLSFFAAQPVKVFWLRKTDVWKQQNKIGKIVLLSPVLIPGGAVLGAVAFPRAGLLEDAVLSGGFGACVGLLSGPIVHDAVFRVIEAVPGIVTARAGGSSSPGPTQLGPEPDPDDPGAGPLED